MRVKFIVPGEPVAKGRPRFNVRTGRAYTPEKTLDYENKIRRIYKKEVNHYFEGYVRLTVKAYYKIAKSDSKKKKEQKLKGELRPSVKPDLDNIIKCIDALNGVAFKDDSYIVEVQAFKYYSDEPRVEFIIEDLEGDKDEKR